MEDILFVVSLTCVINYFIALCGKTLPVPILHYGDVTFGNTYISTPAIMYQVYFWAEYFNLIK